MAEKKIELLSAYVSQVIGSIFFDPEGYEPIDCYKGEPDDVLVIITPGSRGLKPGPHRILKSCRCKGGADCFECRKCPTPGYYYLVQMRADLGELFTVDNSRCVTCNSEFIIYRHT